MFDKDICERLIVNNVRRIEEKLRAVKEQDFMPTFFVDGTTEAPKGVHDVIDLDTPKFLSSGILQFTAMPDEKEDMLNLVQMASKSFVEGSTSGGSMIYPLIVTFAAIAEYKLPTDSEDVIGEDVKPWEYDESNDPNGSGNYPEGIVFMSRSIDGSTWVHIIEIVRDEDNNIEVADVSNVYRPEDEELFGVITNIDLPDAFFKGASKAIHARMGSKADWYTDAVEHSIGE